MPEAFARRILFVLAALAVWPAFPQAEEKPATAAVRGDRGREEGARGEAGVLRRPVLHLAQQKPDTGDVTCSVQKTWRKEIAGQDHVAREGDVAVGPCPLHDRSQARPRDADQEP